MAISSKAASPGPPVKNPSGTAFGIGVRALKTPTARLSEPRSAGVAALRFSATVRRPHSTVTPCGGTKGQSPRWYGGRVVELSLLEQARSAGARTIANRTNTKAMPGEARIARSFIVTSFRYFRCGPTARDQGLSDGDARGQTVPHIFHSPAQRGLAGRYRGACQRGETRITRAPSKELTPRPPRFPRLSRSACSGLRGSAEVQVRQTTR